MELRQFNVCVMQVKPGEVVTDFFTRADAGAARTDADRKLEPSEIAHVVLAIMLTLHDVGFITRASVWATNP